MLKESSLKHPELAGEGKKKIDWVADKMDILNEIKKEYEADAPFKGMNVAICLHLEAKMAYMAKVIKDLGARVAICGSNPLSTQDDVAAGLAEYGVEVHSWYGATEEEYDENINKVLDIKPHLLIDDGGDLVEKIHAERRELIDGIIGGAEETTTGVHRLRAREKEGKLNFPMIAVNDAYCKYLFDNRYGTGQSVWDGIMRTTNLVIAGKTVVVVGYGWCGKGVAMRAKGLGARVIICDVDPIKASEAWMDGFEVMPVQEAAKKGDIFITVTGCKDAIREEHFQVMKDGVILANAGHFDVEISKPGLSKLAVKVEEVRDNIKKFQLADGRKLYLLADGRLVNLAAGDGHPVEIMDMSFGLQVSALLYLNENRGLENRVYNVPREIDEKVARLKLKSLGITIDELSPEQKDYLASW
ncbi:MAG: adenosylhomocysteinase [Halanaerobiales bacterium]|nr:adenosylhomocysteinase [Halanaerobiales bacterium]